MKVHIQTKGIEQMKIIRCALAILPLFGASTIYAGVINVNCNTGDSLAAAVSSASRGDHIMILGNCNEPVVVKVDDLILDGQDMAIIDGASSFPPGPVLHVTGARGVTIRNLDVQNGILGVSLSQGAHVTLSEVSLRDQQVMGINAVEKSLVSLADVEVMSAGVHGMNIAEGSNIKATGAVSVSGSGVFSLNLQDGSVMTADKAAITLNKNVFGLHISVGSTAFVNNSTIEANENSLIGVAVDNGSKLFMFSSKMEANNNGLDGVDCNINSNVDFDAASALKANNNGRNGISLEDTTFNVFSFFVVPGPRIEVFNNARDGVILTLGSKFDIGINSQLEVAGNGSNGLSADDGSTVVLTNSTITGHGLEGKHDTKRDVGDLRLTFGSRASAAGATTVTRTVCDKSALVRGGLVCDRPFIKS